MASYGTHYLNTSLGAANNVTGVDVNTVLVDKTVNCLVNYGSYKFIAWPKNETPPGSTPILHVMKNNSEYVVVNSWWSRLSYSSGYSDTSTAETNSYGVINKESYSFLVSYSISLVPAPPGDKPIAATLSYTYYVWVKSNSYGGGYSWASTTGYKNITCIPSSGVISSTFAVNGSQEVTDSKAICTKENGVHKKNGTGHSMTVTLNVSSNNGWLYGA